MRLTILSDTHFGFGSGTEREQDSFDAAREALEQPADAVIIAGDLFDMRVPSPETFARAMELLVPLKLRATTAKLTADGKELPGLAQLGTPVVAIAGNHERRARGLLNPVEALERAGLLVHLHGQTVVLQKGDERVAIHGLSWVPDQYAADALQAWSPKPLPDCTNILLLHQNLAPWLSVEPCLRELPQGFDCYINGHIHEPAQGAAHGKPVLIAGSAVPTQMKEESAKPKGWWSFDTARGLEFHPFASQRSVHVIEFDTAKPVAELIQQLERALPAPAPPKRPLIRIKLTGPKPLVNEPADLRLRFEGRCFLSFRADFAAPELAAATLADRQLSVQERGRELLRERLSAAGLDPALFEQVAELLLHKKPEQALALLRER